MVANPSPVGVKAVAGNNGGSALCTSPPAVWVVGLRKDGLSWERVRQATYNTRKQHQDTNAHKEYIVKTISNLLHKLHNNRAHCSSVPNNPAITANI